MSTTKQTRKLTMNQETIRRLESEELDRINGGNGGWTSAVCCRNSVDYCNTNHLRTHLNCAGGI